MTQKLIILNNGLRNHLGHYFETSISIAEAARRAGLHPVLATHVDCRTDLLPMWLESYPIFCTDHWMVQGPAEPPDLSGIPLDPYTAVSPSPSAALGRHGSVRQFLAGRFQAFAAAPAPVETAPANPAAARILLRQSWWACRKAAWAADRAAFYLLPPLVYDAAAGVGRIIGRFCLPRILRRVHRNRVRSRTTQIARRLLGVPATAGIDPNACMPETRRSLQHPVEHPIVSQAIIKLSEQHLQTDLEYSLVFKRDLERLLALAGAGPGDHVLMGTAHAREILAVQLIGKRLGESRMPEFHLEFRHPLFQSEPTLDELANSPNIKLQRAFLSLYEEHGPSPHIHFYTDTKELSHDYELLGALPFGVLPIPFRSELIQEREASRQGPLQLAYLGEARDEKGFPWLSDLINDLMDDYVRPGKVRFLLQANVSAPQYNPRSMRMLEQLKQHAISQVQLFGLNAPLSPEEYYSLVSRADAVLLPYDRDRYRACSSGTLAEAISGGRPAVVPANSWMSSQLPPGAGETFHDYESFVGAVKRIIDNYDVYRKKAEAFRPNWAAHHSPDCLIARMIGRPGERIPQSRAA